MAISALDRMNHNHYGDVANAFARSSVLVWLRKVAKTIRMGCGLGANDAVAVPLVTAELGVTSLHVREADSPDLIVLPGGAALVKGNKNGSRTGCIDQSWLIKGFRETL